MFKYIYIYMFRMYSGKTKGKPFFSHADGIII